MAIRRERNPADWHTEQRWNCDATEMVTCTVLFSSTRYSKNRMIVDIL